MTTALEPGRYHFTGIRWCDAYHRQFVTVRGYATIIAVPLAWGSLHAGTRLVVLDGSRTRFRLDRFEGRWEREEEG